MILVAICGTVVRTAEWLPPFTGAIKSKKKHLQRYCLRWHRHHITRYAVSASLLQAAHTYLSVRGRGHS